MAEIRVITLWIKPSEHEAIREQAHEERLSINMWLTNLVRQRLGLPHVPDPMHQCPHCESSFADMANYEEHYMKMHASPGKAQEERPSVPIPSPK